VANDITMLHDYVVFLPARMDLAAASSGVLV